MEVRHANMNDLAELAEIEAECFPPAEAADKESIEGRLKVFPNHFWVLEGTDDCGNKKIISFVNGFVTDEADLDDEMYEVPSLHKEDGKWQMIFGLNTRPEYQRHGYAGIMLDAMEKQAREEGRCGLVLTCKDKLIHYYEAHGYKCEGVSKSVHGNVTWYQMRVKF